MTITDLAGLGLAQLLALVVIAFASYRVTRLLVADSITEPLRVALWHRAFQDGGYDTQSDRTVAMRRSTFLAWVYELATCPWCLGMWISAATWLAWSYWPWRWVRVVIEIAAVAGLQGLLASRRDA